MMIDGGRRRWKSSDWFIAVAEVLMVAGGGAPIPFLG